MLTLEQAISGHDFRPLFVQELGWERGAGTLSFPVRGRTWSVEVVAHKRGLQVCWCQTDRYVLLNRYLVRDIHARLTRLAHENILILSCDDPRKQVWAWAVRRPDGDKFKHREHPFFSAKPPPAFVQRLKGLEFTLEDEEGVGLTDAVNRVRVALDVAPTGVDLFVKKPAYARLSDTLAAAMKAGDTTAFHRFILLHRPLARKETKRLCRWFGMPAEDAEQIGILGLLKAAGRYELSRGIQFSTFAIWWIRHAGQRYGGPAALMIQLPNYVLWPCLQHSFRLNAARSAGGPEVEARVHDEFRADDPRLGHRWPFYLQARQVESLADRDTLRQAVTIRDPILKPEARVLGEEIVSRVRSAVERLHPRYAEVIRRRFGIGCEEETLNEIGTGAGLTRERIRQIEAKGLSLLRKSLGGLVEEWWLDEEQADSTAAERATDP